MTNALIAALLRELLDDSEALAALRKALAIQPSERQGPPAYTVATLAQTLGISEKTIRNAITRASSPPASAVGAG